MGPQRTRRGEVGVGGRFGFWLSILALGANDCANWQLGVIFIASRSNCSAGYYIVYHIHSIAAAHHMDSG